MVTFNFVNYFFMHVSIDYVACKWRYAPFVGGVVQR